jgi:glycosyltransferase involved in cell wall biosynthesis
MSSSANRPLRVLLVSFVDDNRWTGMGKWTHCIADELQELGHHKETWFADDFPSLRKRWRWAALLFPVALAWRLWQRRTDFDVVVIHEPAGFWYGLMRRLGFKVPPMIAMCHNIESKHFEEMVEFGARQLSSPVPTSRRLKARMIRTWQSNGTIRLADQVICLSSIDRDYLVNRLSVSPRRITCLTNGVAADRFPVRHILNGRRVLFVGGWLDVKGKRILPPLWSQVRANVPEARLTILGSGQSSEAVLADFPAQDRSSITVIPRVTGEADVIAEYSRHDIFLMPSLSEGSPLAMLEAMAAGLAVIATQVGGIPDLITHGLNGLLFAPTDTNEGAKSLCRLLRDPECAARMAAAASERAGTLTWRRSCEVFLSAVERAAGRPPQSAVPEEKARGIALTRASD